MSHVIHVCVLETRGVNINEAEGCSSADVGATYQVAIDRPPNGVTTTSSDKMMYEFGHSLFGPVGKDLV